MGSGTGSPQGMAPGALVGIGTTVNDAESLTHGRVELLILSGRVLNPGDAEMGEVLFQAGADFQNDGQSTIEVNFQWAIPGHLEPGFYPLIWTVYDDPQRHHVCWVSVFRFEVAQPRTS